MRTAEQPMFKLLGPGRTGVHFSNTITTTDSVNMRSEVFIYNGAGVAVGDIDNDGLPDLYFTGNMVSSRLYLNKGDMRFEDITESAGVGTSGGGGAWANGVALADVNDDGLLDLYVCVSGLKTSRGRDRANLLFLNNGNRTFTEAAARYGLADTGFATNAVFLDYDGDRDLDLFLLNNSPKDFSRGEADNNPMGVPSNSSEGYNKLYRNDGDRFTDVSREAGILNVLGHGLGVAVADVNRDGRPDIYVSNDVVPNDVLYINNGDGTFTDRAGAWLKHSSFAGMGVDIADFNGDGWPDIVQVDMLPPGLEQRKRMSGYHTYVNVSELERRGFRIDYDANSLQLSNGRTDNGDVIFSEIGHLAGIAATDWSWSPLFADFDNDGAKDLFITNGYPKAPNDLDYQIAAFRARQMEDYDQVLALVDELYPYHTTSYLFRNNRDFTFSDRSRAWGITEPAFSYGAAYADLNNDGRLDLVVNNIDAAAFVYEGVRARDDSTHYLQVRLDGESPNRRGIGAQLKLTAGGAKQYAYHSPYRGYLSTMDEREHFGLGRASRVDTLEVVWPDGRSQILTNIAVDRALTVRQEDATRSDLLHARPPLPALARFQPLNTLRYHQTLPSAVDYEVQPLLPYEVSRQGPALAVADVNRDGLEDVFIGGMADEPGRLFVQQRSGRFVESTQGQPWAADTRYDDWGALFFDANGDSLPDLYVASCGYQLAPTSRQLQDRLYINRGGGRFARDSQALPPMPTCTAAVTAGDFNGDGRPDLFVGGRLSPRRYPLPTRSYLLSNDGGRFTDVTSQIAPELAGSLGMITAAVWIDFDGDGRLDLVTAGEWMPLQFYRNEGRFRNVTASTGLGAMRGWWFSLAAGDFNRDGRPDLVAGNLGLNSAFTTSPRSRFGIYAGDFTGNQATDIVLTKEVGGGGAEYPFFGRAKLGPTIYPAALRFPTYAGFAAASVAQLFDPAQLQRALHYQTDTFASLYLQNNGHGTFTSAPLPSLAQIAPLRGIVPLNVDGDGNLDLIVAGNLMLTEPNTPPLDAGNGLWLRGDGRGRFTPVAPVESGFLAPRNVAGLALLKTPAGSAVLVANTGDSLQAFTIKNH
jgi:hypothetical protein